MKLRLSKERFFSTGIPILLTIIMIVGYNIFHDNDNSVQVIKNIINQENNVSVHFLDVGQGDSELILDHNKAILIDAGEPDKSSKVYNYLKKYNITEIEAIIATHPHSDHIGGIAKQITNFTVKNLILPTIPKHLIPTTQCYTDMLKSADQRGVNIVEAKMGMEYKVGDGTMKILGPIYKDYDNLNLYSIPVKYQYKDISFLMCGDMEKEAEVDLISSKQDITSTVFKLNHHGSASSNTKEFLSKVNAEYYVIEVGNNNSYKLPNKSVIKRTQDKNTYRTDRDGDIVFLSDGQMIEIRTQKNNEKK